MTVTDTDIACGWQLWEVPAGVKHWHGAAKNSWFSHLAFMLPGEGMSNEWLEPVTDAEYDALVA